MDRFWSDIAKKVQEYTPGEQPKDRKYLKLNTNESPYPPSPLAVEAIKNAAGEGLRLYPDPEGSGLKNAVAQVFSLRPEQVFVGNGSDEILAFCFLAFFNPGETIAFPDITYSFYPVYADLFNVPYVKVPLNENLDIPIESFFGGNCGVIIANPNAPTGSAVSLCDIEKILRENPDHAVIIDEAYVDFGAQSAVGIIDKYPNLLVVRTLSKSRALAGLRVGFAMGHDGLVRGLEKVKNSINSYTLDRLALAGAEAAIRDTAYFEKMCGDIMNTRNWVMSRLKEHGFMMPDSSANFIFITHPKVPGVVLYEKLRENNILVRHFDKPRISGYIRVSMGTDEEMEHFCRTIVDIVDNYV